MPIRLAVLFLFLGARAAEAQKSDTVWIRNGDRIIGEVKSMSRGLLKYSTDDLGTISIEWDKVERISTTTVLEVQLRSGEKRYGHLGQSAAGYLMLRTEPLSLGVIARMIPIENRFVSRLSGYLDLGFSYQKAHNAAQLSTGGRLSYRGPGAETTFDFSTFIEDRDDAEETSRLATSITERLFLGNRWSTGLVLGYDRSDELDLAGRGRLVGFGARELVQSDHIELRATGGLVLTQERYFSADSTIGGVEALAGAAFRAFRYDRPKLDGSVTSQLFPSLSVQGRVRMQNDLRLSYELVKDFMITGTIFDAFDSKPQAPGAPKHDFGTALAITWSF